MMLGVRGSTAGSLNSRFSGGPAEIWPPAAPIWLAWDSRRATSPAVCVRLFSLSQISETSSSSAWTTGKPGPTPFGLRIA
jgi:hypothetical protein